MTTEKEYEDQCARIVRIAVEVFPEVKVEFDKTVTAVKLKLRDRATRKVIGIPSAELDIS